MPLLSLRPGNPDRDLRRRSTIEPYNIFRHQEQLPPCSSSTDYLPQRPVTPSDQGIDQNLPGDIEVVPPGEDLPPSPPVQKQTANHRRFSMLRFRHASDPQLSYNAKQRDDDIVPPVPRIPEPPAIITTAPTLDVSVQPQKKKLSFPSFRPRPSLDLPQPNNSSRSSIEKKTSQDSNRFKFGSIRGSRATSFNREGRTNGHSAFAPPLPNNAASSLLAPSLPSRAGSSLSETASSETRQGTPSPTKSNQSRPGPAALFKLPRRSRQRTSLFPLPVRIPPPDEYASTAPTTPRHSPAQKPSLSSVQRPSAEIPPLTALHRPLNAESDENGESASPLRSQSPVGEGSSAVLAASAVTFAAPGTTLMRNRSTTSARSTSSSPARALAGLRARSSTMGSVSGLSGRSDEIPPTPPLPGSGRNSTSTAGRSSFSNLFGLGHRFRQNSGSDSPRFGSPAYGQPGTPGGNSKQNSFNLSRETLIIPTREEGETPSKYLARLEDNVSRSLIAAVLSKSGDDFSLAVLRSHMRSFSFFGDPIDMALRKLLMEVTLPRETQQIDRVVQGFADRYQECNPGIFSSAEQAYFIAFSIIILHTDVFNKNNKRKMQRHDYLRNTANEDVSEDVLGCFYDNIVYTPFIHVDDESDQTMSNGLKGRKTMKRSNTILADQGKRAVKEPLDPYTLIMESKLNMLRPPLKEVMNLDDPYNYLGTADSMDVKTLQRTFFRYGVLQIVSARSRPDAFMTPETTENPQEAQAGLVEIKITKIGLLWRKGTKKKTARSPWQEWGAVLTGTQLYFFKNTHWIKGLIHQYETHQKQNRSGSTPVVFKPPLTEFKPDAFLPTEEAVALLDSNYKRHKHAFLFVRRGGIEETFLAENEAELNDWLARLNYAAAFVTAGIRIRGLVGGNYEGQRNRGTPRLELPEPTKPEQASPPEVKAQDGKIDPELAYEILAARRELMQERVLEAEAKIGAAIKQLELQLKDARHLQILAPIQQKTREQIMHAAGVVAAKLKWIRIEIWRMKCHRDILALDLEEEKKIWAEAQSRNQKTVTAAAPASTISTTTPKKGSGLTRLASLAGSAIGSHGSPKSPTTPVRPGTATSNDADSEPEDTFKTPPETSQLQPSPVFAQMSLESSFIMDGQGGHRGSVSSQPPRSPRPPSTAHRSSISSAKDQTGSPPLLETVSKLVTQNAEEREQDLLRKAGLLNTEPRADALALDGSDVESNALGGSPDNRSKMRRSLHRSLRDSRELQGPGSHQKNRKHRESGSSAVTDDTVGAREGGEGLSRANTSFTLHGRKASVITFGSEWQKVPAEERLKARKPSRRVRRKKEDGNESAASGSVLDDGTASLTSQHTATARSVPAEEEPGDGLLALARGGTQLGSTLSLGQSLPSRSQVSVVPAPTTRPSSGGDEVLALGAFYSSSLGVPSAASLRDDSSSAQLSLETGEPGPEQSDVLLRPRPQNPRAVSAS